MNLPKSSNRARLTYVYIQLMLVNADEFSTNKYSFSNNYVELKKPNQSSSQLWSMDFEIQQQSKQKTWQEKISPEITMKQVANKVKMAAEGAKNKIMGFEDSLI